MQATVQNADNIDNALLGFTISALPPDADDPVTKATSIMLTVNNKSKVEAIVDSGLQIISMLADIANELGIIYNPTIHFNMQSANGTVDRLLGLAKNVECMIGD
ncbi:hypothetical protein C0992_012675 [Termitomyces sp. T32_za158]|nr:hypothetical protein C0992_012675 [Termitomyces sp. T32_za158]